MYETAIKTLRLVDGNWSISLSWPVCREEKGRNGRRKNGWGGVFVGVGSPLPWRCLSLRTLPLPLGLASLGGKKKTKLLLKPFF